MVSSIAEQPGFWGQLPRNFTVLAPMEDVTDVLFRDVILRAGRPHVFFTEFVSVKHLVNREPEALRRLAFRPEHRPIVAQIWGNDPRQYEEAVPYLVSLGFDGIDINMGCPQPKITKKGSCSALILNPALARELILAAKEGMALSGKSLPLSVKTRIGFSSVQTEQWCGFLLDQDLAALTVHGRIAAQMSEGQADWQEIARVVHLRNAAEKKTLIIGNGDIQNHYQLETYGNRYGVDGLMVGRGIFENPFLFLPGRQDGTYSMFHDLPREEHIQWALDHLIAYEKHYGESRNSEIMKKFFKVYLTQFAGAEELRAEIMETHSYGEARSILEKALK